MEKAVNVNFKIDPALKRDFDRICSDIGLSLSSAITVYIKKVVAEKRIPFELTANDPYLTDENIDIEDK